jgi:hypothetical protein
VDSMLHFSFERGVDGMKRCQKMKWRQQAHLTSMGRKCDTAWWHGDIGRRREDTGEEKGSRRCQLG